MLPEGEAGKEQGREMGKGSTETLRPWYTERIANCVKIREVRPGMLSLGLVSSIPALGGSRDLKFERCSAQNLMHWFCLYYKLFLLLGLRLHLGEEQRLFSVFRNSKMLFRSVGNRNLLFACLESVEKNIWGWGRVGLKGADLFFGRPVQASLNTKQRNTQCCIFSHGWTGTVNCCTEMGTQQGCNGWQTQEGKKKKKNLPWCSLDGS